ncbi:hypothetical protein LCGC14_2897370 [marine sediment metagenome]|uniref:5-hmdU DNA kinase helical domain-containing protein n=1 Tax=marine sediment metagenome TaxID=412755 RepID=A0A0F8YH92_9ZZZZ
MTISLTSDQVARGPRYGQLRQYFRTARERYNIYLRRTSVDRLTGKDEPPPWTKDPIFLKYKFCNVFREQDKVTVWLRENWREPYADHPNLPFAMALARLINWPPTLEEIGFPKRWNPDKVLGVLHRRKDEGKKIYTGAYLLGSCPKGQERAIYLVHSVLSPLHQVVYAPLNSNSTLKSTWEWFRSQRGIGDFLAYEIVSDLRHTKYLRDAPDIMTWANAGPGALRGLTRLWGYQPKTRQISGYAFPKKNALEAMQTLLAKSQEQEARWGLHAPPWEMPSWEMREVEHHLCEFDKYERIRLGQGVLERFTPKAPGDW